MGTAACSASIPQAAAAAMQQQRGATEAPAAAAAMAAQDTLPAWQLAPARVGSTWRRLGQGAQDLRRRDGTAAAGKKGRRVGRGCRSRRVGTQSVPRADWVLWGLIVPLAVCICCRSLQSEGVGFKLCLFGWVWVGDAAHLTRGEFIKYKVIAADMARCVVQFVCASGAA